MTTLHPTNWNKTTPDKWQRIGDILIYIVQPIAATAVQIFAPPQLKAILTFAVSIITIVGKALTKMTHQTDKP